MERRVDKVDGADEEGEKKPFRNCERVVGKVQRVELLEDVMAVKVLECVLQQDR